MTFFIILLHSATVAEESKNKGLSSAAIGGIISGVVLVLIGICCCCACFTFCRRRSRPLVEPTTHAHRNAPIMTPASQIAAPMYEVHYVQVVSKTSADGGLNKYQPIPV